MQNLKNIVVLKDLPSNLIEEAFIVLKKNHKAVKFEPIENKIDNTKDDYIIKEAEMLVNNCVDNNGKENVYYKKYVRMCRIVCLMGVVAFRTDNKSFVLKIEYYFS